jgi:hypothetical protein
MDMNDYLKKKYIKKSAKKMIEMLFEKNINKKEYIQKKNKIIQFVSSAFYNNDLTFQKNMLEDKINAQIALKNATKYVEKIINETMLSKYPVIVEE